MKFVYLAALAAFLMVSPAAQASLDINTADMVTLDRDMKGVGAKTAKAIVVHRTKYGPFKSVDDLMNVKGMRKAVIDKNRANLTVSR